MYLDTNPQRAQLGAPGQVREPPPLSLNSAVLHFLPAPWESPHAREWRLLPDPCTPHQPRKRGLSLA